jgi:hypothetical protein
MKFRAVNWLLLLVLVAILVGVTGCETNEPENASVRPWNTPQDGQGGALGGMNYQHE